VILRFVLAWLPVLALLVGFGVLRERARGPEPPPLGARRQGALAVAVLLGGYVALLSHALPLASPADALVAGGACCVLTAITRLAVGYGVAGRNWSRLRDDFDPRRGGWWPFLLLWIAVAPWAFHWLG